MNESWETVCEWNMGFLKNKQKLPWLCTPVVKDENRCGDQQDWGLSPWTRVGH